jgi:hypothetical protein
VVFVQIFLNAGRSVEVKRALFARLGESVARAGFRKQDLLVNLVEVARKNWSFGDGLMSSAAVGATPGYSRSRASSSPSSMLSPVTV